MLQPSFLFLTLAATASCLRRQSKAVASFAVEVSENMGPHSLGEDDSTSLSFTISEDRLRFLPSAADDDEDEDEDDVEACMAAHKWRVSGHAHKGSIKVKV